MTADIDPLKANLARLTIEYGNKADLQKEIDRLLKVVEAKKGDQ